MNSDNAIPAQRFTAMSAAPVPVARSLLGQRLVRVVDGVRLAGTIVEVEAYLGAEDRGAHTFAGRRTARNASMYLPGGHAYVYFTYGMHHCLNVVCGGRDDGVAVLIRAIEPTEGMQHMFSRRPAARSVRDLCSGPGRLAAALAIDLALDGEDLLASSRLFVERIRGRSLSHHRIIVSARIGLNPAPRGAGTWADAPLRFCLRGSPFVSRRCTATPGRRTAKNKTCPRI